MWKSESGLPMRLVRVKNVRTAVFTKSRCIIMQKISGVTTRYHRFDRYYLYVIHVFDDHELLLHKHNFKNDINYR